MISGQNRPPPRRGQPSAQASGEISFRDVGLIVNKSAGAGLDSHSVQEVLQVLGTRHVVTGLGQLGGEFVDPVRWRLRLLPVQEPPGRVQSQALARSMAAQGLGLILVMGGDGTLADVAGAIADVPGAPVVCGIGAGSMSVGELTAFKLSDVAYLDSRRLEVRAVPAIVAKVETTIALAFNDVVLGTTLVGTLDGRVCDLDAAAYLQGQRLPGRPLPIGRTGAVIKRTGTGEGPGHELGEMLIAGGRGIGGVVAGLTSSAYVGRAITGGVCLASWAGVVAGCVVSDVPLARVGLSAESVLCMRPLRSSFTALTAGHRIVIEGVRAGTAVLADGNPLALLKEQNRVEIAVRQGAVRAVKTRGTR
jgi:Diacylglycerol kinase catalytic domain